jgi:hypothetical protein
MHRCTRGAFFTALTLCTIGVMMGLFILALVVLANFSLLGNSTSLTAGVITGLVVSALVFLFSIYVSWRQNTQLYKLLSVIILVFPIGVAGLAIWALASREGMVTDLGKLWDDTGNTDSTISSALEQAFHCCGWDSCNSSEGNASNNTSPCNMTIGRSLQHYAGAIGGSLLGFALVLIVGVIVAFWMAERTVEASDELESRVSGFTDPLVLGSLHESGLRNGSHYYW